MSDTNAETLLTSDQLYAGMELYPNSGVWLTAAPTLHLEMVAWIFDLAAQGDMEKRQVLYHLAFFWFRREHLPEMDAEVTEDKVKWLGLWTKLELARRLGWLVRADGWPTTSVFFAENADILPGPDCPPDLNPLDIGNAQVSR